VPFLPRGSRRSKRSTYTVLQASVGIPQQRYLPMQALMCSCLLHQFCRIYGKSQVRRACEVRLLVDIACSSTMMQQRRRLLVCMKPSVLLILASHGTYSTAIQGDVACTLDVAAAVACKTHLAYVIIKCWLCVRAFQCDLLAQAAHV
jgi:hypothetical protein